MKDPTAVAADWAAKLAGATAKITAGVQAVAVAPGTAAARQKAVWAQNVAASQDKWAANVAAVPLQTWQGDMINKGIPRIAQGAQQSQAKMAAFLTSFLPFVDQHVRALPPRGTLEQNIARMTAHVRNMANYKRPASAR